MSRAQLKLHRFSSATGKTGSAEPETNGEKTATKEPARTNGEEETATEDAATEIGSHSPRTMTTRRRVFIMGKPGCTPGLLL